MATLKKTNLAQNSQYGSGGDSYSSSPSLNRTTSTTKNTTSTVNSSTLASTKKAATKPTTTGSTNTSTTTPYASALASAAPSTSGSALSLVNGNTVPGTSGTASTSSNMSNAYADALNAAATKQTAAAPSTSGSAMSLLNNTTTPSTVSTPTYTNLPNTGYADSLNADYAAMQSTPAAQTAATPDTSGSAMSLLSGNLTGSQAAATKQTAAAPSTSGSEMSLLNNTATPSAVSTPKYTNLPNTAYADSLALDYARTGSGLNPLRTLAMGTSSGTIGNSGKFYPNYTQDELDAIWEETAKESDVNVGAKGYTTPGTAQTQGTFAGQSMTSPNYSYNSLGQIVPNYTYVDDTYDNGGYIGDSGYAQPKYTNLPNIAYADSLNADYAGITDPTYQASIDALKSDMANAETAEQQALIQTAMDAVNEAYGAKNTTTGSTTNPGTTNTGTNNASTTNTGNNNASSSGNPSAATPGTSSAVGTTPTTGAVTTPIAGDAASTNSSGVTPTTITDGFNYDLYNDPVYQAYRKEYLAAGDRASENALGQAAAASAGRVSSSAVTAATQAGDYYAQQMANQIPTLEENAYQRYLTEQEAAKQQKEDAYNNITSLIAAAGYMPTDEELAAAGMNREQAESLYYQWVVGNPLVAYTSGKINAAQYVAITGTNPPGVSTGGGGGKVNTYEAPSETDVWTALGSYNGGINGQTYSRITADDLIQDAVANNASAEQMASLMNSINSFNLYKNRTDI